MKDEGQIPNLSNSVAIMVYEALSSSIFQFRAKLLLIWVGFNVKYRRVKKHLLWEKAGQFMHDRTKMSEWSGICYSPKHF